MTAAYIGATYADDLNRDLFGVWRSSINNVRYLTLLYQAQQYQTGVAQEYHIDE